VLPTLVFVAFPTETNPVDIEVLLAACNQTYTSGECRAGARPQGAPSLSAEVRWVSEGSAQVNLRFTLRDTARAMVRSVEFQAEDEPRERFKALGFVVGSLAGTATDLIRVDEESKQSAPITKPETAVAPNKAKPQAEHTPNTEPAPPVARPSNLRARFRLAALSASGLDGLRWGGLLGASAVWDRRWVLDVHGTYTTQAIAPGDDASFVSLGATFGFESHVGHWALGLHLGPRFVQVRASSAGQEGSLPPAIGAQVALQLRYVTGTLSPYLELDGLSARKDTLLLDEGRSLDLAPIQAQVALGFTLPDLVLEQEAPTLAPPASTSPSDRQ
jgi:hypothetical protein